MANNVNQRQFLALKLEALSESEVGEVLDYISTMESKRRARTAPSVSEDELLAALADAHENRRARQALNGKQCDAKQKNEPQQESAPTFEAHIKPKSICASVCFFVVLLRPGGFAQERS